MRGRPFLAPLGLVALLALAPVATQSNVVLNFLIVTLIISIVAQAWNLLGGFGGQFSFGHAAFFGMGAYVSALWQMRLGLDAWSGLAVAVAAGAALAFAIGFLAFRAGLRGSYFALVTLAFAEVFRVLTNSVDFTGGAAGLLLPLKIGAGNLQFSDRTYFYWLVLLFVAIGLLGVTAIRRSRFGAQLVALRENEEAASALGVDVLSVKLKAMALSGAMAAAAGVLYLQYFLYIDAQVVFGSWISVEALLASIVGGLGTVLGPVLGALALHGLGELAKALVGGVPGIDLAFYGAVLLVAIAFMPGGLIGLAKRWRAPVRARSQLPARKVA
ncbi:branched-chain amino acid ABC transporter permease [Aureimonas ureilytica]|uniref:branched-chain amino acid ABC transporter permease n=1 Tax=Aureimonas ureilytica TaxID=401562 RepID=UPI0003829A13|nr:branched-chain amino acid ABC transporter permease [Aureimonas ureilytica]